MADKKGNERGKPNKRLAKKKMSRSGKEAPFQKKKKKGDPLPSFSNEVRLNKFLANAGICSRREADVLIKSGVVEINGKIVTQMGIKVKPSDEVKYDGAVVQSETKRYILLNKPKNFITAIVDPKGRKTVYDLVKNACKETVYPVGKLDRDTTGLMLFTNDSDMEKRLMHPKYQVSKLYHVTLSQSIKKEELNVLVSGVELEDGTIIKASEVELVPDSRNKEVGIELHSSKSRVVQRMFEAIGYNVIKLDRVKFACLTKKDLPRGRFRNLTEKEVNFLKMV